MVEGLVQLLGEEQALGQADERVVVGSPADLPLGIASAAAKATRRLARCAARCAR